MKKTSKILLIVVSLLLVLITLTGCGKNTTNENKTAKETIARGVIDENNVYKSEYAGINFALPEGFIYASDLEIADMMNVGAEILSEGKNDLTKVLEQTALYDMVAQDATYGTSVMVMFEKATANVSVDYYLKNVKKGLESVTDMGYVVSDDITTETVGGKEYKVLTATIPTYGLTQKYYTQKKDGYFIDILITYYDSAVDLNTLLANFK